MYQHYIKFMKNIFLLIIFLFLNNQSAKSQGVFTNPMYYTEKYYIYDQNSYGVRFDIISHKYEILNYESYKNNILTFGSYFHKDKYIFLYVNKKNVLTFKVIDKYRIVAITKNKYFKIYETIFLNEIQGPQGTIQTLSWNSRGLKDGWWTVLDTKGIRSVLYKNGVIKETKFETWDQIHSKQPKL